MRRSVPLVIALTLLAAAGCDDADEPRSQPVRAERPAPSLPPAVAPSGPDGAPATAQPIVRGPARGKRVALTFDADMTAQMLAQLRSGAVKSWYAEDVIRVLRRTETPATLFITGLWARAYPGEVRSLHRDPLFEVGSHTWDHRAWTTDCYGLPAVHGPAAKRAQVLRTARLLARLTGRRPRWFRFPGLCHAPADVRLVAELGEQAVDGIGSGDAFGTDPGRIVATTLEQVRPGAIVVMHMHGGSSAPGTAAALRELIPALRDRGYRLVTLSRLLGRRPTR